LRAGAEGNWNCAFNEASGKKAARNPYVKGKQRSASHHCERFIEEKEVKAKIIIAWDPIGKARLVGVKGDTLNKGTVRGGVGMGPLQP